MKKYLVITLLCTMFSFMLLGCMPAPPENSCDELKSHTWILYDGNNKKSGTLNFAENHMILTANTDEKNVFELDKECIINENKIIITSEDLGALYFEYKISGDTLILSYLGKKIIFKKK